MEGDRHVRLILLFGSLARGGIGSESDIDLIVVKETEKKFLDRLDEFYEDVSVAIDLLVYTPDEFNHLKKRSFIKKAMEEGVTLYEA